MDRIYYSTMRPIGPGTCPKKGLVEVDNYDIPLWIPAIGKKAWGSLTYNRELTEKELEDYELISGDGA